MKDAKYGGVVDRIKKEFEYHRKIEESWAMQRASALSQALNILESLPGEKAEKMAAELYPGGGIYSTDRLKNLIGMYSGSLTSLEKKRVMAQRPVWDCYNSRTVIISGIMRSDFMTGMRDRKTERFVPWFLGLYIRADSARDADPERITEFESLGITPLKDEDSEREIYVAEDILGTGIRDHFLAYGPFLVPASNSIIRKRMKQRYPE